LSSVLDGLSSACKLPDKVGKLNADNNTSQEALLFVSEHRNRQADESEEHTSVEIYRRKEFLCDISNMLRFNNKYYGMQNRGKISGKKMTFL